MCPEVGGRTHPTSSCSAVSAALKADTACDEEVRPDTAKAWPTRPRCDNQFLGQTQISAHAIITSWNSPELRMFTLTYLPVYIRTDAIVFAPPYTDHATSTSEHSQQWQQPMPRQKGRQAEIHSL